MTTPLLAVSYKTEGHSHHHQSQHRVHHKHHTSMEKRLMNYYLRLYRDQCLNAEEGGCHEVNDDDYTDYLTADEDNVDEDEDVATEKLRSNDTTCTSEYNNISIPKDYSRDYMNEHKIWKPKVNNDLIMNFIKSRKQPGYNEIDDGDEEDFLQDEPKDENQEKTSSQFPVDSNLQVFDEAKFLNYLHLPKIMGPEPLPPLIYHTSCDVNGKVYLLGGASTAFNENDSIQNLSNYIVDGIDLPKPINSKLLNNPTVLPNRNLYVISSETTLVSKPQISGDIPPPLLAMSGSKITDRHIFYYGGFEILNQIKYNADTEKIYIKKSIRLNNSGYVLDVVSLKFRKFELIAHPNTITRYPLTVPRFGHSSCAINLSKHLRLDTGSNIAATVFIAGGFRQDRHNPEQFKTIRDLWKVELSIIYKGKHGYVQFGDNVLATPIPGMMGDGSTPLGRAFHYAEIFDSRAVQGKHNSIEAYRKNIHNPNKIGIARPSSPTASVLSQSSSSSTGGNGTGTYGKNYSNEPLDLKLIVHGGTDGEHLLGDVWWFDFDSEIWYPVSTYFHDYDEKFQPHETIVEAQLKRAGHCGILVDKYLYVIGGAIPSDFGEIESNKDAVPDISSMSSSIKNYMQNVVHENDHYQRLFILNLSTQTWLLTKYFHGILPLIGTKKSLSYFGNTGLTVTQCNSKVFVVGGQVVPHSKFTGSSASFKMNILNNSIGIFEFPLGCPLSSAQRKLR